ncbi:MAG: NAD(P)-binding protein, partial [Rhodobacteraceae bacterium]|nr:NAD(P)-binding protein [Paracoccaceae bacterium]
HAPGYAEQGLPGERYRAYQEAKAKGGTGLIMFGGSSNISRDSGSIYGQIYVGDDRVIPAFRSLSEQVQRHGALLMCQVTHMGRRTTSDSGDWLPTKGPSAVRDPAHHSMPYEISPREIRRIVADFAAAARRCRDGGLDGIEILGSAHLLGQFISPLSNLRTDDYGGSLKNRARFLIEVLEACRDAVANDVLISMRTNFDESNEGGLSSEEGVELARLLGAHGAVDMLNVNGAYGGTDMGLTEYMPGMAFAAAPYVELARRVREASGLPTLQAARLSDPATADWAIGQGYLDVAGMTRPLIADPDIVAKLSRGHEQRIRPCVGAGYCLDRIYAGREAFCQHNVSTGREMVLPADVPVAATRKRVVVVGGGPAGMEASRVLALRGHEVTLFEAQADLGGQVRLAAKGGWRKDVIGIADWLAQEIDLLGVDVQFNTYADDKLITAENPDVVLIATGGIPIQPLEEELPSVWDVLGGQIKASGEILIYDGVGEHAALSLADMLAQGGHQVRLVTPDRHLGRGIGGQNVPVYMRNLTRANARVMTDYKLVKVSRAGNKRIAHLRNAYTRELTKVEADMIISDFGVDPVTDVFDDLRELSCNLGEIDPEALVALRPQPMDANPQGQFALFRIGDALAPRDIHAAMLDANRLARTV